MVINFTNFIRVIREKIHVNSRGFTLVELLVAAGIFVTLVTVAAGAFIQGLRSTRHLTDLMAVSDNAGVVLEQMAREIRTGYLFCGDGVLPCDGNSSNILSFTNHKGESVSYKLSGVSITRNDVEITAPNVRINNLVFIAAQAEGDKCSPWRIAISMEVGSDKVSQTIPLQTTISSRVLPREVPGAAEEIQWDCPA